MSFNKLKLNAEKTNVMLMGTSARLSTLETPLEVELAGIKLKQNESRSEILLGVKIQSNLKWSEQIKCLVSKLQIRLAGLEKLKYNMNRQKRKTIVQGVFSSVLCYCIPLFGGCNQAEVEVLQTHQNRAARIALQCPPRTNHDWMFDKLEWTTVLQLISYHTLVTIFRVRFYNAPEYLALKLSRDSRQGQIMLEDSRLDLHRKSFVYRGAIL